MIGSLRGILQHKKPGEALIDVQGVGYEVLMPVSAFDRLPNVGQEAQVFVSESMAMYGGGLTLYGFLSVDEKEIYLLLKEIPGTGSRKALDYLDKIGKSLPDFRRAVIDSDLRTLTGLFGFTKKTAEKMIVTLKERFAGLRISGTEKWKTASETPGLSEALAALVQLGYRELEARTVIDQLPSTMRASGSTMELVREALKQLS